MNNILADQTIVSNRYQIVRQIGRGGMGAVYETIDLRLQTTVALKQRMTIDDVYRHAFEREARILARLRHSGLPVVSDHFFEGDDQFLVMEYVAGPNLQDLLADKNGPLDEAEALRIADQILEILEYLHSHTPPIIHRDIKPQNIKISGEARRAVLLDFGLAKGSSSAGNSPTLASIFGYTRNYAPPEQINNTGTDQRTDVYSLGATLYHMLTGQAPAPAEQRMFAAVNAQPDPLQPARTLNPRLSREVSELCTVALALASANRFQTASAMRAALRETTSGRRMSIVAPVTQVVPPPVAQPRTQPTPIAQPQPQNGRDSSQRTLMIVAVAVVLLVVLGGASAAFAIFGSKVTPQVTLTQTVAAPTRTPRPSSTATSAPSATAEPPSATAVPPTYTPQPTATDTPQPSSTPEPPSATPVPPTRVPPTRVPPTRVPPTRVPPSNDGGIPEPLVPTIAE
ncbi:MAG: protein kinase [Oscillochloris sp.]|nr:protein kinase [Oscillochloris sp.]